MMGQPPDVKITSEIGREICERQGLKAFVAGSIASLGSHYVLTLVAVNGHSGAMLAREVVFSSAWRIWFCKTAGARPIPLTR
jgi:hypothetical protein